MKYQNYIFDLYGTLLDIRTNENNPYLWKKMSGIYSALGAVYTPAELKKEFRRLEREAVKRAVSEQGAAENTSVSEQEDLCHLSAHIEVDLRRVFMQLFEQKGVACDDALAKTIAVTFRALSRKMLCVYEGVHETLAALKAQGKGIYLLSNAQSDFTRPELAMTGLERYFDGILISSEEGVKKPGAAFYECLFERFGLEASACLMVGNDESSDIAGALAVGMDSLYIHTEISPPIESVKGIASYSMMDGDWGKVKELLLR